MLIEKGSGLAVTQQCLFLYLPARFAVFSQIEVLGLTLVDRKRSLLSQLQYPVLSASSAKDLTLPVPKRRLSRVLIE